MALIKRYGVYYADFRVPNGKRSRTSLQTTNLRVAKDKYAEIVSRRKKAKENLAAVDMLLFAGADVNARGENGITALINSFSVTGPEANTIRTRLLKAKPDVNAVMNLNLPRCKSEDRIWGSYLWGEDQILGRRYECIPNPATALSLCRRLH